MYGLGVPQCGGAIPGSGYSQVMVRRRPLQLGLAQAGGVLPPGVRTRVLPVRLPAAGDGDGGVVLVAVVLDAAGPRPGDPRGGGVAVLRVGGGVLQLEVEGGVHRPGAALVLSPAQRPASVRGLTPDQMLGIDIIDIEFR